MNTIESFLNKWEKKAYHQNSRTKLNKRSQIKKLIEMRSSGERLATVGGKLGITAARVSQIYREYVRFEKRQ